MVKFLVFQLIFCLLYHFTVNFTASLVLSLAYINHIWHVHHIRPGATSLPCMTLLLGIKGAEKIAIQGHMPLLAALAALQFSCSDAKQETCMNGEGQSHPFVLLALLVKLFLISG